MKVGGSLRELVLLLAGLAVLAAGLLSRPRDPATVGVGVSLLVATPAVAAAGSKDGGDAGGGAP